MSLYLDSNPGGSIQLRPQYSEAFFDPMKLLTLIRHGTAGAGDAGMRDFDRPLAKQGRRQAEQMGQTLAQQGTVPDTLLISASRRTVESSSALVEPLGVSPDRILAREDLYLCTPGTLLSAVQELDDGIDHAALLGHNPGVSDLLTLLVGDGAPSFPNGAVAQVEFDIVHWIDAAPGRATLLRFDVPDQTSQRG
jgi:phosphohistidine phosphatase